MSSSRVLLYLPGVKQSDRNSAVRIAQLIAASESRIRPGTYTVEMQPDGSAIGGLSGATVLGPDKSPVLHVVEVAYHEQLRRSESGEPRSDFGALLRTSRYAVLALLRLLRALRRPAKDAHSKWQLLFGLLAVLVMLASGAFVAVALIVAFEPSWLPSWAQSEAKVTPLAWSAAGGLSAGGFFWYIRPRVLRASQQLRTLMRYTERSRDRTTITNSLHAAVDQVLDAEPAAEIFVLGYSFGSLLAVDALFPGDRGSPPGGHSPGDRGSSPGRHSPGDRGSSPVGHRPEGAGRTSDRPAALRGLVTIGCPVDLVRLYYPEYFAGRTALRPDLQWTNLFIPADVFASNFLDGADDLENTGEATGPEPFAVAGVRPGLSIAVSRERLGVAQILTMDGFQLHGGYWGEAGEAHYLEAVIPSWIPEPATAS